MWWVRPIDRLIKSWIYREKNTLENEKCSNYVTCPADVRGHVTALLTVLKRS
jgi:hypothetical protein